MNDAGNNYQQTMKRGGGSLRRVARPVLLLMAVALVLQALFSQLAAAQDSRRTEGTNTGTGIARAPTAGTLAAGLGQAHYRIGNDNALNAMTWKAAADTSATGIARSTNFRVRFQVYNNTASSIGWRPRLEYSATSGSGYAAVPTTSGTAPFFVTSTSQFTNGASISTTYFALGTGTGTARSGYAYNTSNPPASNITLNANSYTEIEFNVQANTNAVYGTNYYFRLTNNGTALANYDIIEAAITMQPAPGLRQAHYRIGDDTALNAMTWKAATDTAATGIARSTNFRVRFQVYNNTASGIGWRPRLDYSATSGSGYAAVPTTSGTAPFFVTLTSQFTNAASISTTYFALGTGTGTAQNGYAYESTNPPATNITLNANSYTEIEFNVQANTNAADGTNYYFRLTNNGTALAGYDVVEAVITMQSASTLKQAHYRIGNDTALTAMTWQSATDSPAAGIARSASFRVRFQVYNDGASGKSWQPQLEWTATSGSGYAAVPAVSGAAPFFVTDTTQFANAASIATGNFGLGAGTGTAQSGYAYDTQNPSGTAITLNANSYTEIEFNIQANANAAYSTSYYFRLADNGTVFDAYVLAEAVITMQAPPPNLTQEHYRIGNDTALAAMTWKATTDTLGDNIPRAANFRIRFQLSNDGASGKSWQPQLEWTATSGSGYAAVPTASGAAPFFVTDTTQFANAASIATASFALGTGTGTAQNGYAYDTQNPAGTTITLNASSYTEIEFNVQANANAAAGTTYYFRLTNAGTAFDAYTVAEAVVRMQPDPGLKQAHYRIGNDTPLATMTWMAATDTSASNVPLSTNFRVRFQVYNDSAAGISWRPQLEWTATSGSGYAAVPTASGATPFFVTDTAQFANAASIATGNFGLGAGTGTVQSGYPYDTQNPAGTAITLNANSYTEIEFNIQANANAAYSTSYYFRLTNAGTALNAYPVAEAVITMLPAPSLLKQAHYRIGNDTALTAMTWKAATDSSATGLVQAANFRIRFQIYNDGSSGKSWQPQLEWTASSGSGYAAVPTASGAMPFFVTDTTQFTNAASIATTNFALGTGTGTAQNGNAYDTQNPAGATITLNASSYTEIEFNVQANANAAAGTTYYFRLTNAGTAFDAYVVAEASITMQPPSSTTYLRSTSVVVGSTTYNYLGTTRGTTAATITSWIDNTGYKQFADTGPHSIFVSDAVPAGSTWTLSGTWTFNAYVKASSTGGTGNMLARIFEIDAAGNASLVDVTVASTANALSSTTSTLVSWTDTIPATVLNPGERYGVEFVVKVTTGRSGGTGSLGIDGASGSSSDSNVVATYSTGASSPAAAAVKQDHYRIGNDDALTGMTWQGATDQRATNARRGINYRLRFQVYNDGSSAASWQPQLEWTATSGSGYAAVPTTSGTAPFFIAATSQFTDGTAVATTNFSLGTGRGTAVAGAAYDASNPPAIAIALGSGSYTEIEFSIQPNDNATYAATYYFRLTNGGAALSAYNVAEAIMVIQTAPIANDPHNNFAATTDKCAICHRTHTGAAQYLRKTPSTEEALCYTCHNGTGATTNIQAQFAKTVTGAPDTSRAGKHPVALTTWIHQTGETLPSQFSAANRHVECEDCHKPHARFPGLRDTGNNTASLAIANASGIRVTNVSAWTAPSFALVTKIAYEYELCYKCHSSWAYGVTPPNAPSGFWNSSGTIIAAAESDQSVEFNTLNTSHHAVEGPGNDQPPVWSNPSWPANGLGLSNTLVSPWTTSSTVQCGDCHARDTSTEPQGTHGASTRWMLRKYEGAEAVSSTAIFCYNCHRRDVYGDTNDSAYDNTTYKHAWSRFPHRWFLQQNTNHQSNTIDRWGIWCMTCHAGDMLGGTHGTNRGVGTSGTTAVGKRFLNGAATKGWTAGTTSVGSGWWYGKGTSDAVSTCTDHGTGIQWTANYNFMP